MNKIFLILFSAVALVTCNPGIESAKVAKIDSLQTKIDSSFMLMEQVDSAKGMEYAKHFFDNVDYIKKEFSDTIDTETAFFIDKYYGLRKAMKLFQQQYSTVQSELRISRQQLKDLKYDAEEGLIEEEQFEEYLDLERKNVTITQAAVKKLFKAYQTKEMYEEMNPKIDALIEADKTGKVAQEQAK